MRMKRNQLLIVGYSVLCVALCQCSTSGTKSNTLIAEGQASEAAAEESSRFLEKLNSKFFSVESKLTSMDEKIESIRHSVGKLTVQPKGQRAEILHQPPSHPEFQNRLDGVPTPSTN